MNQKDRIEVMALIERRSIPEPNSGCWLWDAATDQDGYGKTKWRGVSRPAHRLSYQAFYNADPEHWCVTHSCDIPCCVNPQHLSLETRAENTRAAAARGLMRGPGQRTCRQIRGAMTTHNKVNISGSDVTYELLSKFIAYNPDTGEFRWLERLDDIGWSRIFAGKVAGCVSAHGKRNRVVSYIRIRVAGRDFYAHRLAWLYTHGSLPAKNEIDHINGDTLDNRICNLRLATRAQNGHNVGLRRTNKSGVKGVSWEAARSKWFASITVNGKSVGLGRYDSLEEAAAARQRAEAEYHGAFAHIGVSA